jgi:hypothetical protein
MYELHYIPRKHFRYPLETPINITKQDTENLLRARMLNISDGGMYLESQHMIQPHSDICIWVEKKLIQMHKEIKIYDFYRSKVLWCREIPQEIALGMGVQHINKSRWSFGPEFRCSMCEDKIPMGKVHFVKDFLYFCPKCSQEMERCSKNSQDEILRFLEGNVF